MIAEYLRPKDLTEARAMLEARKDAVLLAGGTFLLAASKAGQPFAAVSVSKLLPKGFSVRDSFVSLGAGTTFQEIVESPFAIPALRAAALGMADRNIRNRATVGGNIGADRACASLVPVFLVLEAVYVLANGERISAAAWHEGDASTTRKDLIVSVEWETNEKLPASYCKYSRTACDIAILTCAVAAKLDGRGRLSEARVALGGLSRRPRRFPAIERGMEGRQAGDRAAVQRASEGQFEPISDARGSADFKRARAVVLLADALAMLEASR